MAVQAEQRSHADGHSVGTFSALVADWCHSSIHALTYATSAIYCDTWHLEKQTMDQRTARIGKNNRAQVVTIPLEYRFPEGMKQVFIRKIGEDVVLSPHPLDWSGFLGSKVRASDDFMAGVGDLPVQERDFG